MPVLIDGLPPHAGQLSQSDVTRPSNASSGTRDAAAQRQPAHGWLQGGEDGCERRPHYDREGVPMRVLLAGVVALGILGGTATSSAAAPVAQGATVVTPFGLVQTPTVRQGVRLATRLERGAAFQQAQLAALATPTGGWIPLATPLGPAWAYPTPFGPPIVVPAVSAPPIAPSVAYPAPVSAPWQAVPSCGCDQ
jgi:hypothetical protein